MKKIFLIFCLLTVAAYGMKKPDSVELDLSGSYGSINGFIQVPKGGQFGSSTDYKPTFDQVGIKNNAFYNMKLGVTYDSWTYYAGLSGANFNGSGKLSKKMITHGVALDKGTHYTMKTPIQFVTFGAKKKYMIGEKLSISPLVEIDFERISYTWSAKSKTKGIKPIGGTAVNSIENTRGYFNLWAPAVGAELRYTFTEKTSIVGLGKGIIPIGSWRYYFYGSVKLEHEFFSRDARWFNSTKGYIGVEAFTTKSRDNQDEMQNWIEITQIPMVTAGFIVKIL